MTVIHLHKGRRSLRGHLTRWMLEVGPGIYVGTVSPRVREHLWALVVERLDDGAAVMVHSARTEQGFSARSAGRSTRRVVDCEGLLLTMKATVK